MIVANYLEKCVLLWHFGSKFQKTVLYHITIESRQVICQLLVSDGVTLNARNSNNCTPLHYVARQDTLADS